MYDFACSDDPPANVEGWVTSILHSCGTMHIQPKKALSGFCTKTHTLSKWSTEWGFCDCWNLCTPGEPGREGWAIGKQALPTPRFFRSLLLRTRLTVSIPLDLGEFRAPRSKKASPAKSFLTSIVRSTVVEKLSSLSKQHLTRSEGFAGLFLIQELDSCKAGPYKTDIKTQKIGLIYVL